MGNYGVGGDNSFAGQVSDVHKIDNMGERFVVEDRHANHQPDHRLLGGSLRLRRVTVSVMVKAC